MTLCAFVTPQAGGALGTAVSLLAGSPSELISKAFELAPAALKNRARDECKQGLGTGLDVGKLKEQIRKGAEDKGTGKFEACVAGVVKPAQGSVTLQQRKTAALSCKVMARDEFERAGGLPEEFVKATKDGALSRAKDKLEKCVAGLDFSYIKYSDLKSMVNQRDKPCLFKVSP